MSVSKAKGSFIPVSPRKVRLVARSIRGLSVLQAQSVLRHLAKGACRPVGKVLDSAVANATHQGVWKAEQLVISQIMVNEGPVMKRHRAGPMGRAMGIGKRLCHLIVELEASPE